MRKGENVHPSLLGTQRRQDGVCVCVKILKHAGITIHECYPGTFPMGKGKVKRKRVYLISFCKYFMYRRLKSESKEG